MIIFSKNFGTHEITFELPPQLSISNGKFNGIIFRAYRYDWILDQYVHTYVHTIELCMLLMLVCVALQEWLGIANFTIVKELRKPQRTSQDFHYDCSLEN